jgi:hypothetical protein
MALSERVHLPSFAGATGWLNSEPLGPAELRNHVVLVNFWTWDVLRDSRMYRHNAVRNRTLEITPGTPNRRDAQASSRHHTTVPDEEDPTWQS